MARWDSGLSQDECARELRVNDQQRALMAVMRERGAATVAQLLAAAREAEPHHFRFSHYDHLFAVLKRLERRGMVRRPGRVGQAHLFELSVKGRAALR